MLRYTYIACVVASLLNQVLALYTQVYCYKPDRAVSEQVFFLLAFRCWVTGNSVSSTFMCLTILCYLCLLVEQLERTAFHTRWWFIYHFLLVYKMADTLFEAYF
jgi:hypothetical protein